MDFPNDKQEAASIGRLKQSIVYWCFNLGGEKWNLNKACQVAVDLGCASVELLTSEDELKTVQNYGLTCALMGLDMTPEPPFLRGFNNPNYWPMLIDKVKNAIDLATRYNCPNLVVFTGYSLKNIDDSNSEHWSMQECKNNCVAGFNKIIGYAEKYGVTLCLEPLNTRVIGDDMKGHPGYQGAHFDDCLEIVKRVDSSHFKLLMDIYHTQIMDGDIIRRIQENIDYIGHVHTAGNPGRGELDDKQEIAYQPIMKSLFEMGYRGFIGHEYIPTRDPVEGLKEAIELCSLTSS